MQYSTTHRYIGDVTLMWKRHILLKPSCKIETVELIDPKLITADYIGEATSPIFLSKIRPRRSSRQMGEFYVT